MIYVIGDSHCLSFDAAPFKPYLIAGVKGGVTAYGLGREKSSTDSRKRVLDLCKTFTSGDTIVLCFGEVDCRNHIYYQYRNRANKETLDEVISKAIASYGSLIKEVQRINPHLFALSIPPTRVDNTNHFNTPYYGTREERTEITIKMNQRLKLFCEVNGVGFVDIYSKITDSAGRMLKEYVQDEIHCNNKIMPLVFAEMINVGKIKPAVLAEINGVSFDGSSYRIAWVRSRLRKEKLLNIGVGTQVYGDANTVQFDMDRYKHEIFVQGDAHHLPFKDGAFDTVLISDVMEHIVDPTQACKEATRVSRRLRLSIFEEWRLGGEGRHIEVGRKKYERALDDPSILGKVPEEAISHAPHIWQFTDKLIKDLIWSTQWKIVEFCKEPECLHEGHLWWNWLIVLKKPEAGDKIEYPGDPMNYLPAALVLKQFDYKR